MGTNYKDKFNQAMRDMAAAQEAGQTAEEYYAQKQAEEEAAKKAEEERVAAENREKSENAWTTAVSAYAEQQGIDPNTLIDYLKSSGEWDSYIDSFNDAEGGLSNYLSKLQEALNKLENDRESGTTAVEEANRWAESGRNDLRPEDAPGAQTSEEQAKAEAAGDTYTVNTGSSNLSQEQAIKSQEEAADKTAAANTAEQTASTTAQGVQTSAINAGLNKSKAGMLGSNAGTSDTASSQLTNYATNSSQRASTQADYLEKMAQANAASLQAQNLNKSAGLAGLSGALQGAGTGASMGATISDERCKEAPEKFDDNKLMEAVQQFFELKRQLDELKERK